MARREPQWDADEDREYKLSQLYTRTRRALRSGQIQVAAGLAREAAQLAPNTTTVEELLGDVAFAQEDYGQAREHFQRALDIEPINADAERKLGEVAIILGTAEHLRERVEEAADDPTKRVRFAKQPLLAGLLSFVFPGFGQLYNGQYEKGLGLFALCALLVILLLDRLVISPFASMARQTARDGRVPVGEQMERTRDVLASCGFVAWALIVIGIALYLGLWIYTIIDAYRTCQRLAREADELGVEL